MKPTLKEIEDNYERVLLQLDNGNLAGIKKFSHTGDYSVVEQQDWNKNHILAIELSKGYKRKSINSYNIDRIKILSDRNEVDNFLQYEECEIDWDWDIDNPHNLKFKKGDVVRICHEENRSAYVRMLGKIGTIVDAEYTRYIDDERITYRVRVDDSPNEYQEQGLWVFHKEKSLKLYNPQCDDQMDAYTYSMIGTRYNIDDIIKGDNNNMMNEILEIYDERELKKINEKYNEMEQTIKQADPRYKIWKECVDTLEKLYKEDKVPTTPYVPIALADETMKKLSSMFDDRRKELDELYSKKVEVNAQLSMCETYEQKQEILRRYNIINKNGKVNG